MSAAITVSDALREAVGKSFTTSTDLVKWGDIPDKYEIVIGNTNRKETAAVMAELSEANPYAVKQVEKRIVIVGINAKYLAQAVTQFLLEYTGQSVVIEYLSDETVGTAKPVMPATPTVATTPAITTGDQTGHPEISAKEVDVEMLLTTKADYDYASEYKIRYNGTPCTVTIPTQTQAVLIKSAYDTLYNVVAGTHIKVVGVRQNNLRASLFQIPREYPFHRRLRTYGHVYRGFNIPVRCMQNPCARPRFRVRLNHFKRKKFVIQNPFRPCFLKSH
jgi:hypothetical protein